MKITKLKNTLLGSFMLLIIVVFFPKVVFGIGQTTDPIVIKDAIRGKEYQETMIVINTERQDAKISLTAEGQVGAWTKFYKQDDLKNAITETSMKAGESRNIIVVFKVPSDAPNGEYSGFVSAIKKGSEMSSKDNTSGASVSQKIDRKVAITVSDKENVLFEVSVIPKTYDLKKDELLSIRLVYDNRGNVSIAPQAQIKIKSLQENGRENKTVYSSIFPYPEDQAPVKAGAVFEIPALEIPTSKLEKGKYLVEMSFLQNGKQYFEKKFNFTMDLDSGTVLGAKADIADAGAASKNNSGVNLIAIAALVVFALGIILLLVKKLSLRKSNEKI